jgi:HK97 family phage portal protein
VFNRNKEIFIIDDTDLYDESTNAASKRLAIESVIGFIARIIIQSEFRIKKSNRYIKDITYYKFNVKPNKNQTAAKFWHDVVHKLIYDGECLIIKSRTEDLLIADDYNRKEYAVKEDVFSNVYVKGLEMSGTFTRNEVLFFEYGNEQLSKLVDSLFYDYGELISRMFETQKTKNQVRSTVEVDGSFLKTEEGQRRLQNFIDKAYKAFKEKAIAIVPNQKGMAYQEHSKQSSSGQSVDEINKTTDGFLDQVCHAVGLPPNLLKGDMADVENMTRNAMKFCIDPIIKIIHDELNMQFVDQLEYLKGEQIQIKRISYRDMFDIAVAVDKLRSSSVTNGHELRDEIGLEHSDDPIHDKFIMTKNYESAKERGDDNDE